MKKYYIIRQDGSSLFRLPYDEEFIFHCLIKLLDITEEKFRLLRFVEASELAAVQADRGTGDEVPCISRTDKNVLKNIRTYIRK